MAAAATAAQEAKKSVDNTVFVRFLPPSDAIRRHHVEDLFSDCGPIKKSSVIHAGGKDQPVTSSYGFVKYTVAEDAALAAMKLNNRTLKVADGVTVTVKVELAKTDHTAPKSKRKQSGEDSPQEEEEGDENQKKKTNRLILRNLSFYAKETDIRKALAPFGELLEVHIPKVEAKGTTHRGFCFVTFATGKAVKKFLAAKEPLVIKERAVNVARSLHKTAYQSQHQFAKEKVKSKEKVETPKETSKEEVEEEEDEDEDEDNDDSSGSNDDDSNREDDNEDGSEDAQNIDEDESDDDDDSISPKKKQRSQTDDKTAVAERRCLFLRNLPFDCTRHDVFEAFRRFGFITSIYIVKDKETNKIPKGTAFVAFQLPDQATKALEFAAAVGSSKFVSQRSATVEDQWENRGYAAQGIVVKGRRLLVDLAVDKETATTLTVTEKKQGEAGGKDRRNLYLKGEGRVENDEKAGVLLWDELPEGDKLKRQTAWSEKNTKLRSPLFFINPIRLSLRNLAKHVDEAALKKLVVEATVRGLSRDLVSAEDQIAHWRAACELSTREILAKVQETAGEGDSARSVIPAFDEKNVRQSIPSLHIHRDVAPGGNKKLAPSRGFAFVEFEHHVHALACLRELNNNTRYSAEYATGGKQAAEMKRRRVGKHKKRGKPAPTAQNDEGLVDEDGKVRIPRLIVEFTVENKAKAKQQAEHKAQQQANLLKQREELKTDPDNKQVGKKKEKEKKKSRGAAQREKKRKQQHEEGDDGDDQSSSNEATQAAVAAPLSEPAGKVKGVKPPKKQKVDKEEEKFSKLVESYKQQALAIMGTNDSETAKSGRRWFD